MRRLTFVLWVLVAACGGDATGPDTSFTGTYAMQSLNGSPLPAIALQTGTSSVTIVAGQLTVADGGTWVESVTWRTTQSGQTTTEVGGNQGVWVRSLNTLTLNSTKNNNIAYTGTFSSRRLDLSTGALIFVYTK